MNSLDIIGLDIRHSVYCMLFWRIYRFVFSKAGNKADDQHSNSKSLQCIKSTTSKSPNLCTHAFYIQMNFKLKKRLPSFFFLLFSVSKRGMRWLPNVFFYIRIQDRSFNQSNRLNTLNPRRNIYFAISQQSSHICIHNLLLRFDESCS